jgi:transketolase
MESSGNTEISTLEDKAKWIKRKVLDMYTSAWRGHLVSTLSCIDIFVALYYEVMNVEEDVLIVSKGHANAGLYPILVDKGIIPAWWMAGYGEKDCPLRMHADPSIPGVEYVGGSLGNGLGFAAGRAMADKNDGVDRRYYVIVGDAELYEGSNWEALMYIAHNDLPITVIVDRNRLAILGETEMLLGLDYLEEKFLAFGIESITSTGEICDEYGIVESISYCKDPKFCNRPAAVIVNTTKGDGISFMENERLWHTQMPKGEQLEQARNELDIT